MNEWGETTFGALGRLFDGPHATPERIDVGPYFLNISSLKDGRLDLAESDHVSEEDFSRWTKRVTPEQDDLLFSYETRLGDAALMPAGVRACLGRRMALMRPDKTVADPRFLLYMYLSPEFQKTIEQHAIQGATVNRIPLKSMGEWRVRIPPLGTQRAIADVLSALDGKIAGNAELATTADELARAEFTAALRGVEFPALTFADVAKIGGGGTPRSNVPEFWGGGVPWLTPTDVTSLTGPYVRSTKRTLSEVGLNSTSSKLYPSGSIFMTSRATIGAFAIAERPMAVNQGFIVVESKDEGERFWLFHEMRSRVSEFLEHANGATFLELSRGNFKKLPVRWPERGVIRSFGKVAGALHNRASAALQESDRLIAARDTLLPALMSGRLTVRDAESALESAIDSAAAEPDAASTSALW